MKIEATPALIAVTNQLTQFFDSLTPEKAKQLDDAVEKVINVIEEIQTDVFTAFEPRTSNDAVGIEAYFAAHLIAKHIRISDRLQQVDTDWGDLQEAKVNYIMTLAAKLTNPVLDVEVDEMPSIVLQ